MRILTDKGLKRRINKILVGFALTAVALSAVFPLYFMIITALKTRGEYLVNLWGWPRQPTLANFSELFFAHGLLKQFKNSLLITVSSCGLGTIFASMAAYAFSKMQFRLKDYIFSMNVGLMSIPAIIMIIPLFVLMTRLGLLNTYISVILVYVGVVIPATIYLLTRFFDSIPNTLIEAAKMDGCSTFRVFLRILLPLSKPALMTALVVNMLWVWNDLLMALVLLQDEDKRTLMVGVASFQGRFNINIPLMMAGLLVAALPLLLLYFGAHKHFIEGLTEGSLKE